MRKWTESVTPKELHDKLGMYHGEWMPQMDRYWKSDDGYCVMSRMLNTEYGKVEHVTITLDEKGDNAFSSNGERGIPWNVKQQIKNELFGKKRTAIEVYPSDDRLIDVMDVYHLWVFDKNYQLPFGIHPKDKKAQYVNRGYKKMLTDDVSKLKELVGGML